MTDMISRINELKKEQNLTTEALADRSGVPLGTLTKILSRIADSVKLNNISAIALALGVSLDYLVYGIPVNTNNYSLSDEEIELIEEYRSLDVFSRELIRSSIRIEHQRALQHEKAAEEPAPAKNARKQKEKKVAREIDFTPERLISEVVSPKRERKKISLYNLPVSAGTGQTHDYLSTPERTISIPVDSKTATADYAVRISGQSMEPKFHDGDILLVQATEDIKTGDLGIFMLDNECYFKVFADDRLLSLNPDYSQILLKDFSSVRCQGKVLGKLKKSTARQ